LRLPVRELQWTWSEDAAGGVLTLSFGLPAGGYATTVLRELFDTGYVAEDGG
jgi:tRNA pseudouridine13 synthase